MAADGWTAAAENQGLAQALGCSCSTRLDCGEVSSLHQAVTIKSPQHRNHVTRFNDRQDFSGEKC